MSIFGLSYSDVAFWFWIRLVSFPNEELFHQSVFTAVLMSTV